MNNKTTKYTLKSLKNKKKFIEKIKKLSKRRLYCKKNDTDNDKLFFFFELFPVKKESL